MINDLGGLGESHWWPQAKILVVVMKAVREISGVASVEQRYYISSLQADAGHLGTVVRGHWGVENGLHALPSVAVTVPP